MRRKLFNFIKNRIFKIPEGRRISGLLLIIKYLLFPLHSMICKIKNINYDFPSDVYTINGVKIHGDYFYMLKNIDINQKIKVTRRDSGVVTIERIID